MRNDEYLRRQLVVVWNRWFSDVKPSSPIQIKFGRRARKRLGSIGLRQNSGQTESHIFINGHFRDETVPDFVVEATIAHELCHYVHGFSSSHPQLFRYPHKGDVVEVEMARRDLSKLAKRENDWLQAHWRNFLTEKGFSL
ncbi:MAG: hypothetical protein AAB360_03000 [Patescibacteria group bacterium]